jgi:hypothetical protein
VSINVEAQDEKGMVVAANCDSAVTALTVDSFCWARSCGTLVTTAYVGCCWGRRIAVMGDISGVAMGEDAEISSLLLAVCLVPLGPVVVEWGGKEAGEEEVWREGDTWWTMADRGRWDWGEEGEEEEGREFASGEVDRTWLLWMTVECSGLLTVGVACGCGLVWLPPTLSPFGGEVFLRWPCSCGLLLDNGIGKVFRVGGSWFDLVVWADVGAIEKALVILGSWIVGPVHATTDTFFTLVTTPTFLGCEMDRDEEDSFCWFKDATGFFWEVATRERGTGGDGCFGADFDKAAFSFPCDVTFGFSCDTMVFIWICDVVILLPGLLSLLLLTVLLALDDEALLLLLVVREEWRSCGGGWEVLGEPCRVLAETLAADVGVLVNSANLRSCDDWNWDRRAWTSVCSAIFPADLSDFLAGGDTVEDKALPGGLDVALEVFTSACELATVERSCAMRGVIWTPVAPLVTSLPLAPLPPELTTGAGVVLTMVMGDPELVLTLLTDHWMLSGLSLDLGEFEWLVAGDSCERRGEFEWLVAGDSCERRGEFSLDSLSFFVAGGAVWDEGVSGFFGSVVFSLSGFFVPVTPAFFDCGLVKCLWTNSVIL